MKTANFLSLGLLCLTLQINAQQICFDDIREHLESNPSIEGNELFDLLKGCSYPLFNVKTVDGQVVTSGDLKNKVVVMNFWNLDYQSCKDEIPALNQLVEKYRDEDVIFLSFNNNTKSSLTKFLGKNNCEFMVVAESQNIHELMIPIEDYPINMIFNRKGKLVYGSKGAMMDADKTIYEELAPLIDYLLIAAF